MARKDPAEKAAPIVAELGRAESPEETAARKAENSRKHRANQTTRNLVLSLAASLGLVLLVVLIVVRPAPPAPAPVDWLAVARAAQATTAARIAAPELPKGWTANSATIDTASDGSAVWHIGFLTPKKQFIALEEGIDEPEGWAAGLLGSAKPSGSISFGRHDWAVYDRRATSASGNFTYSLVANVGGGDFVLHGTADDSEFAVLVEAVTASMPIPVD